MTRRALLWVCTCTVLLPLRNPAAQTPQDQLTPEQMLLVEEHAFGGLPTEGPILVRQGYVSGYNAQMRVPDWVAFHVKPEYRDVPKRQGKFSSFRQDPDVSSPVKDADYNGLLANLGYARGHLAPYAVMGGDRDGDGLEAADDEYDAETIFEANYMSNIAPQHQKALNGSGGLWYSLERWIQDDVVVTGGEEVWVFAGCIFGPGETEKVGPQKNIGVPPLFYQIVLKSPAPGQDAPKVLAFLFPHQRARHGEIQDFLVSVDVIESMTGLDFLPDLDDETEEWLERNDTWENWAEF